MEHVDWYGLYKDGWKGQIVTAAISHPAKFPRGVIRRIYAEMLARGWLQPGDHVLDCFGGVALGALDALQNGLHWHGCELESDFYKLGLANLALWQQRYAASMPHWGTAELLLGDSRHLRAVLAGAQDGCVTSPPYGSGTVHGGSGIDVSKLTGNAPGRNSQVFKMAGYASAPADGDLAGVIASPPYAETETCGNRAQLTRYDAGEPRQREYGQTPGQLGDLPVGTLSAVISSPPYAETRIDGNGDEGASGLRDADGNYLRGAAGWTVRKAQGQRYGGTPGQLGALPAEGYEAVVASPPYAETQTLGGSQADGMRGKQPGKYADQTGRYSENPANLGNLPPGAAVDAVTTSPPYQTGGHHDGVFDTWGGEIGKTATPAWSRLAKTGPDNGYGDHPDQVTGQGETFWSAARAVVQETYALLKPGGVAAFMTGDYVRNKQRVRFGEQWLALCVAVGYTPLLWATVWKVEGDHEQLDVFGAAKSIRSARVSFFRRQANTKNPDAAIWNEDVLFLQKGTS